MPQVTQPAAVVVGDTARYLGEEVISGNDASQNATLPDGTSMIWVSAEGRPVYVTPNGTAAAASSGVYVPENNVRLIGPYTNITSLGVFAATGDKAHLIYSD